MRVLRLSSVYGSASVPSGERHRFDVIGGMQVHTALLTAGLDGQGVEQTVVTAYRPGAPRVESVGEHSRVVRTGIPIQHLRQLFGVSAIPEVARTPRVDLVHVHVGEDLAVMPLAWWAALRADAPLVVTVHCSLGYTLVPHDLRSRALRSLGAPLERHLLRSARAVLVLSDRLADRLETSGVPRAGLHIVPLGIDLDDLGRPHPRPAAMDGRRWIVYVGRVVREKGVRDLVDAFAKLPATDTGLLIGGDGADRPEVAMAACRAGVEDRVRFIGPLPHGDVPPYLQHADVVVLPSWYEERGRILLEAMAAGAPVVATRTGGIPTTVRHGENGILVPPHDPERLATGIDQVLASVSLAASMTEAGRVTASQHGVAALVRATLAAYRAALGCGNDRHGSGKGMASAA